MTTTVIIIVITFVIIMVPVAHAELPGENNSCNVFDQVVPTNYGARTFWALLFCWCDWVSVMLNPKDMNFVVSDQRHYHLHLWQSVTHVANNMAVLQRMKSCEILYQTKHQDSRRIDTF